MTPSKAMQGELARAAATRVIVNDRFDQAAVFFRDGSMLRFEHTNRDNRWARPSSDETTAGRVCRALTQFRLNAKHLQLFFVDGSNADFPMIRQEASDGPSVG